MVEQLLQTDPAVKQLHEEFLAIHQSLKMTEPDEPSMRFTKNVMELVAMAPVPKALRTRVDKRVIRAVGGFFIITLSILIIITLSQINWSIGTNWTTFSLPQVDWTKYFGSWMIQAFLLGDIVLGFYMLDRWIQQRRNSHRTT